MSAPTPVMTSAKQTDRGSSDSPTLGAKSSTANQVHSGRLPCPATARTTATTNDSVTEPVPIAPMSRSESLDPASASTTNPSRGSAGSNHNQETSGMLPPHPAGVVGIEGVLAPKQQQDQ